MPIKNEYTPSPLYEQWLEAKDKQTFINSLDDMAKGALFSGTVYQYYREKEYPPIEDYLDAVAKDDDEAIAAYKKACMDVKDKYPKPV